MNDEFYEAYLEDLKNGDIILQNQYKKMTYEEFILFLRERNGD